jgi:hypothetical protein
MADIFNLSDTWNDGATTFSAIKMNVTDTASASGSLLMDLQVGGSSKFSVAKNGQVGAASYSGATGGFSAIVFHGSVPSSANGAVRDGIGFVTRANSTYSWVSDTNAGSGTVDLSLFRDAADTLAQRRSTNPQAFRISNTHTDLSNYERGKIAWESNVLRIGTEKAGTGSARALELQTDGTTRLTISTGGTVTFSADILTGNFIRSSTGHGFLVNGRAGFVSGTTENIQFRNAAADGFGLLQFGGTTDAFPALKRSTTSLQVRLADDSDFTAIQGKITTETAYTAGAPTATGYLVLYDSAGVAYKVPAEAL